MPAPNRTAPTMNRYLSSFYYNLQLNSPRCWVFKVAFSNLVFCVVLYIASKFIHSKRDAPMPGLAGLPRNNGKIRRHFNAVRARWLPADRLPMTLRGGKNRSSYNCSFSVGWKKTLVAALTCRIWTEFSSRWRSRNVATSWKKPTPAFRVSGASVVGASLEEQQKLLAKPAE